MPVLAALTMLLLVATLTLFVLARRSVSAADEQIAALRSQRQQDIALADATPSVTKPALDREALTAQLGRVRTADTAIDTASTRWRQGGSALEIVWKAVTRCMYEVDQYNRTAGWFTAAELGSSLPTSINLKAPETDCGAATLAQNARGSGL